jgi:hypothetical protein
VTARLLASILTDVGRHNAFGAEEYTKSMRHSRLLSNTSSSASGMVE